MYALLLTDYPLIYFSIIDINKKNQYYRNHCGECS